MKKKFILLDYITSTKIITLDQAHEMWIKARQYIDFGIYIDYLKQISYSIY